MQPVLTILIAVVGSVFIALPAAMAGIATRFVIEFMGKADAVKWVAGN